MKYKIMMGVLAFLLIVSMVNVSAVTFWQERYFRGNYTTQVRGVVIWDFGNLLPDKIKSGSELETYVWYNMYPQKWNRDNPNYAVRYCNMTITFWEYLGNSSKRIYNQTFTSASEDKLNAKYFVNLNQGDSYDVDIFCVFSDNRPEFLEELPADFSIVTPTWECKECQYYEWSVLEQDIAKAKTIGDNTLDIVGYIKQVVLLNYEIAIALFWLILLSGGFIGISLVFVGVYWLFLYFRRVVRVR